MESGRGGRSPSWPGGPGSQSGEAAAPYHEPEHRRPPRDCRWPESKLTVELDSYTYHHTRHAWEQDYRRERKARVRGDEFRRYNYGDVIEDQTYMLAELRDLLP